MSVCSFLFAIYFRMVLVVSILLLFKVQLLFFCLLLLVIFNCNTLTVVIHNGMSNILAMIIVGNTF